MSKIFEQYIYPFFVSTGIAFTMEWIFWGAVIIEIALVLYFLIKSFFAYELKLFRKVDSLNLWLLEQNQITEENLIEFNNRMKRVPKILRYQWQQYMLYRDKSPSHYMSVHNCVENPIKSSKLTTNIKSITSIAFLVSAFAFLLGCGALEGSESTLGTFVLFYQALITPLVVLVINTFYTTLLKIRQSNIQVDLFETFHIFERLIDRASTTIPQYVDFEVLFTRQEIKKGIPVLNEYLEKRAREEELELEKARINSVEHIQYDFEAVGMDGALLLERAMRECEIYTNLRARLMLEIGQIESEIESYKKSYENTQKDYQKKLQASKENIERLRTQQETTTNRIESNYIRKQQTDEIKKQQQVEKDFDDATIRYKQEVSTISQEVEKRKIELEEKREYIETVMVQEFKTYSSKVYVKLEEQAMDKSQKTIEDLQSINKRITKELEETNDSFIKKSSEADIARSEAVRFSQALVKANEKLAEVLNKKNKNAIASATPETQTAAQTNEAEGYYDDRGFYIFPNGTYYDNKGNFFDGTGGYYDAAGNYYPVGGIAETKPVVETKKAVKEPVVEVPKTTKSLKQEKGVEEAPKVEEVSPQQQTVIETPVVEAPVVEAPVVESQVGVEDKEGHYDERGFFIYPDGSYYDDRGFFIYSDGTYYDDKGNFYDAEGGYYDVDGIYYPAVNAETKPEIVEEAPIVVKPNETKQEIITEPKQQSIIEQKPEKVVEPVAPQIIEENEEKEETSTEKKGRGRPRKEPTEEVKETKPKGSRGRPRKEPTEVVEEPKPKGSRGRPRKEPTEVVEEPKPKGSRGRPRKNPDSAGIEKLKAEMAFLASEAEALAITGGNQARIDEINAKLSDLVLQIEQMEND